MRSQPFHMVQLWLDSRRLFELGRRLGLVRMRRPVDLSYLVHCALGELFQEQAPRPFCVERHEGPWVCVLGYADHPWEHLKESAGLFADPERYAMCDWERGTSKPMPTVFREGMRLGFSVRVCPVVRRMQDGITPNGRNWKAGQEMDVFLAAAWATSGPLDRETVYAQWFRQMMERPDCGGAEVESVRMVRFRLERLTRRTQDTPRSVVVIQRPDVELEGTLVISDGDAFMRVLRRGVGRHHHFGFGMLKLRRA